MVCGGVQSALRLLLSLTSRGLARRTSSLFSRESFAVKLAKRQTHPLSCFVSRLLSNLFRSNIAFGIGAMSRVCWIVVLIACWMSPNEASSQQPTFYDVLNRLEEHRGGLLSYVARVTLVNFSTRNYGPPVGEFRAISVREIGVVEDCTRDRMLQCSSSYSGESSRQEPTFVILRDGNRFWRSRASRLAPVERKSASELLDPQIIGLGLCAEINRHFSFEEVLGNYKRWPRLEVIPAKQDGDEVSYGLTSFDLAQGCSPLRTGVSGAVSVKSVNKKTDAGIWLPEHAFYDCNGPSGIYIHVDWLAVNTPVAPSAFEPETVARLCGLQYADGAAISTELETNWIQPPKTGTPPESPVDRWDALQSCYRNVFQQLFDSSVKSELNLTQEQEQLLTNLLNENRPDYPGFDLLGRDQASVESFFQSLRNRLKRSDQQFKEQVLEILLPEQVDMLIGRYIVINGIRAFANRAVQDRLKMTDENRDAFKKRLAKQRQLAMQLWANTIAYEAQDTSLSQLDLRATATLPAIRGFLSPEQVEQVARLTKRVPERTYQRLSFGF